MISRDIHPAERLQLLIGAWLVTNLQFVRLHLAMGTAKWKSQPCSIFFQLIFAHIHWVSKAHMLPCGSESIFPPSSFTRPIHPLLPCCDRALGGEFRQDVGGGWLSFRVWYLWLTSLPVRVGAGIDICVRYYLHVCRLRLYCAGEAPHTSNSTYIMSLLVMVVGVFPTVQTTKACKSG